MRKPTVSIGIPAYNEEANIKKILFSLLKQKTNNFILKEILVVSDGSTDKTVEIAKSIHSSFIKVIADKKNTGKAIRLNQIFSMFKGDLVVLIDADILIKHNNVLKNIVEEQIKNKYDLIAVKGIPVQPTNLFEELINYSVRLQLDIRKNWNKGDNYLAFSGRLFAISRKFSKIIKLEKRIANDDTFIFFLAHKLSFSVCYLESIAIYYKSPSTFLDYMKQSSRFKNSKKELEKYFGRLDTYYKIPKFLMIRLSCKYFILNPLKFTGSLFLYISTFLNKKIKTNKAWQAGTTKRYI